LRVDANDLESLTLNNHPSTINRPQPERDRIKGKRGKKRKLAVSTNNRIRWLMEITYKGGKLDGYFIPHSELVQGKKLVIATAPADTKH
jgi:putative alpha-1,2-mannosidase